VSRPGNTIISSTTPASSAARSSTGRWFVVDFAEKGPSTPTEITSYGQLQGVFGDAVSWSYLLWAGAAYFAEGGQSMVVSRELGPTPVASSRLLAGASGNTLKVSAKSPGAWGDDLQVEIVVSGSNRTLNVYDADDNLIDSSGAQTSEQGLIDWSASSDVVTVIDQVGTGLPVALAVSSLSGGDDDHTNGTDATAKAALDAFTSDLGPGQVSMIGRTTAQAHADTRAHGNTFNRRALCDYVDTASKSTLKSATAAERPAADSGKAAAFTPWLQIDGSAPGTLHTIPPSAFAAAAMARNDAVNSVDEPVAGDNGKSRGFIKGLTVAWSEADTQDLSCPELTFSSHGSINVIRVVDGVIQIYGNRTLTDPITNKIDLQLSNVRFDMAVTEKLRRVAQPFVFKKIDARGHLTGAYATALIGVMQPLWQNDDLYGATEADSYGVETGPQVNDDTTAAAGQLIGEVRYKRSPGAEEVVTRVIRYAVDQPLAV
jgi:hypothetical protein